MVIQLKHIFRKYYLIIFPLLFFLLAFGSVAYLAHFNRIYYGVDVLFHLTRYDNLKQSIIHQNIPYFNIYTSIPKGIATMTYYPWLAMLPTLLLSWHIGNYVQIVYMYVGLAIFFQYISAFFSFRTINKKISNDLLFALLYTNSGVLFEWEIRSTDFGVTAASIFVPMAVIGFVDLLRYSHYKLMVFGVVGMVFSHVLTSAMIIFLLMILGVLNLYRLRIKRTALAIFGGIAALIITNIFWYPILLLHKYNSISTPSAFTKYISYGIFEWTGSTGNYMYGFTEIVGLLSIIMVLRKSFHWFDIQLWIISIMCLLFNVKFIEEPIQHLIPQLATLQFSYRDFAIMHICLTFLATKWLTGQYNKLKYSNNFAMFLMISCLLVAPMYQQITYHFLMHNRPLMTVNNVSHISAMLRKETRYEQHKSNSGGLKAATMYGVSNYDYIPKKLGVNMSLFNQRKTPLYNAHNNIIEIQSYKNHSNNFYINNYKNGAKKIGFPVAIYHHARYKFLLNGKKISKRYIDYPMIRQSGELVIRNVPRGKIHLEIESAQIEDSICKYRWMASIGTILLLLILEILDKVINLKFNK